VAIRLNFFKRDHGTTCEVHTPCQSSGQRQRQLMLLARERLGRRRNWKAVFGTDDQRTGILRACQISVTLVGEKCLTSASCRLGIVS
jgi:hypothetical protein